MIPNANKSFLLMFINRISVLVRNFNASCLYFLNIEEGLSLSECYMKEVRILCGTDKTLECGKEGLTQYFVVVSKRTST